MVQSSRAPATRRRSRATLAFVRAVLKKGPGPLLLALFVAVAVLALLGGRSRAASVPASNWTTFDYDAQRSGVGPADTGITRANLHSLRRMVVHLPGTVDSAAVELADASVR